MIKVTGSGFTGDGVLDALRSRPDIADVSASDRVLEIVPNGTLETSTLVPWLIGRGVTIDEVRRETASLEDVYLSLMEDGQ